MYEFRPQGFRRERKKERYMIKRGTKKLVMCAMKTKKRKGKGKNIKTNPIYFKRVDLVIQALGKNHH